MATPPGRLDEIDKASAQSFPASDAPPFTGVTAGAPDHLERRRHSCSVWMPTSRQQNLPALGADTEADVCVVGAGIAGLSVAYHLVEAGKSVVVLERETQCMGNTALTTAHVVSYLDRGFHHIEKKLGNHAAALAAESHAAAIDRIERIVAEENIDCSFERVDGYLFADRPELRQALTDELEACQRIGFPVEQATAPVASLAGAACMRVPRQAQFHPLRYCEGLIDAIKRRGGKVYTQSAVSRVHGGDSAYVLTEKGHTVRCKHVVVASNTPFNDRVTMHTKQYGYLTYVIGARVPSGSVPHALLWDTDSPFHYVRIQPGEGGGDDVLIVGGEDHKTGQADDGALRYAHLEEWARARFPMMMDVTFRWAGEVFESLDGLAYIGRNPGDHPNVYIATGDSGNGMTHGTLAGMMLSNLILGRTDRYEHLYAPARKTLRSAAMFAKENINVGVQYLDWLSAGDGVTIADLPPGGGAVMRKGVHHLAVYRDDHGQVHTRSAVCPHLGGIVHWNDTEKTWDCPCHGSRFDGQGKVIQGPANCDLAPAEHGGEKSWKS